jgi:hypothetical protein
MIVWEMVARHSPWKAIKWVDMSDSPSAWIWLWCLEWTVLPLKQDTILTLLLSSFCYDHQSRLFDWNCRGRLFRNRMISLISLP